jgi:hypothetical protein
VPRGKSQEEEEVAAEEMSMADPKPAPSRLPTWFQSPWSERTTLGLLALLLIDVALALWGFIQSWVYNYKPGAYGNNFTGVWINGFVFLLCAQAVAVLALPQLVTSRPARFWAWMWYTCWLSVAGLICLIGMHAPGMASQYAWTFLWYPHLVVLAAAALARRRSARAAGVTTVDVEASGTPQQQQEKPRACTKEAWRQCWSNYWIFVAWSSLWWVAFLGFFLALQAGFLVTDSYRCVLLEGDWACNLAMCFDQALACCRGKGPPPTLSTYTLTTYPSIHPSIHPSILLFLSVYPFLHPPPMRHQVPPSRHPVPRSPGGRHRLRPQHPHAVQGPPHPRPQHLHPGGGRRRPRHCLCR